MSAKKKAETKPAAVAGEIVTVEVINQSVFENGAVRHIGARFEITADRAEALRHFVKIIPAE